MKYQITLKTGKEITLTPDEMKELLASLTKLNECEDCDGCEKTVYMENKKIRKQNNTFVR